MAKISVPKILETSRLLSGKAGQELQDLIQYVSTVSTQLIQALRNGLNFADNFDCYVARISLTHNQTQIVNRGGTRTPTEVRVQRVVSDTVPIPALVWSMDANNNLVVKPIFGGTPPVTTQDVDIIIHF